jgi:hypothetical protein
MAADLAGGADDKNCVQVLKDQCSTGLEVNSATDGTGAIEAMIEAGFFLTRVHR